MIGRSVVGSLLVLLVIGSTPAQKCDFDEHISCICKWKFENRPHTSARGYFLTEQFWNRVPKVCWKEMVQFTCTERPAKGTKVKDRTKVSSPILPKALARAKQENKLVFFIGLTGG